MDSNDKISDFLDNLSDFLKLKTASHPAILEVTEMLSNCASDTQLPFNLLDLLLKNIITLPVLNIFKSKVIEEIQTTVNNSTLKLITKISDIEEKCLGLEHRIESAKKKFGVDYDIILRKMNEIQSFLMNKPWIKDITPVSEEINSKPNFEDLYSVKISIEPKLEEIENISKSAQKCIKDFEAALARMDEILLTKSSKEDIRYLNTQFDNYVSCAHLEKILPDLCSRIESLEEFEKSQKIQNSDSKNDGCSKVSHRNTSKDFSIIFNKVSSISDILDSKIDKIEILPLLESIELKDITFKKKIESVLNSMMVYQVKLYSTIALLWYYIEVTHCQGI